MIGQENKLNNSSYDNCKFETNSTNSEQINDISFSYKNMSAIRSLLNEDENNFDQIQTQEVNDNQTIQNYANIFNNIYTQYQQLYNLCLYNQYIFMNNKISEYNLIQMLLNNRNKENKKKRITLKNKTKSKKNLPKPENEIKIDLILSGKEKRTFIRLIPIPNKYSPFDIIKLIDKYLKTKKGERIYNSLYVPLAKEIGKNKGYCFINLVSPKYVVQFYNIFNGLYFNLKNSKKPCSVVFSDKQSIECSKEDALKRPIIFYDVVKN